MQLRVDGHTAWGLLHEPAFHALAGDRGVAELLVMWCPERPQLGAMVVGMRAIEA